MKKKVVFVFYLISILLCTLGLIACGGNKKEEVSHTHSYSEIITTATCTKQGFTTYLCECGDTYEDNFVDALGHKFENYVNDNNETCEKDGTKTAICNNGCGEKDTIVIQGSKLIEIRAFVDGEIYQTLYTSKVNNYKVDLPQKPQDITTNRYIEKYFYGWFLDEYCSVPVGEEQNFETNSAIYAKWIKTDSTVFNYTVKEGVATITGRKNKTEKQTILVIPTYINTYEVKKIDKIAFAYDDMLEKVIICEGIETIKGGAFYGCSRLKEIIIPESVLLMENVAFGCCKNLTKINYNAIYCEVKDCGYIGEIKWDTNGLCPYGYGAEIEKIEIVVGKNVEYIDYSMFWWWYIGNFKSVYFENPFGWYCYDADRIKHVKESYAIDNINDVFEKNTCYGKIIIGELVG